MVRFTGYDDNYLNRTDVGA